MRERVTADQVRAALGGSIDPVVLRVATQEPASYWLEDGEYVLDDPYFGPPARLSDLRYDPDLGLYDSSRIAP